MVVLLLKLLLSPLLIVAVTLAVRRVDPLVGALLVALPLTAGPALVAVRFAYGSEFAAEVARGAFAGLLAYVGFTVAYAVTARNWSWTVSLAVALGCYAGLATVLQWWAPSPLFAAFAVLVGIGVLLYCWPERQPAAGAAPVDPKSWELPVRCATAVGVTAVTTTAAGEIGSYGTALIGQLPLFGVLMTVCTHRRTGGADAVRSLRRAIISALSCAAFYACLASTLLDWGPGAAFASATLTALAVTALSYVTRIRLDSVQLKCRAILAPARRLPRVGLEWAGRADSRW
ncbi:hypothetical protein [Nocardia altamirensis]|uniref:hypothetical protein n=1 Tax=Nocardia altamirensis TaxID=472158 RepID=UPI00084029EC|nr:hypothetical protein [Nocardia altamirensis]